MKNVEGGRTIGVGIGVEDNEDDEAEDEDDEEEGKDDCAEDSAVFPTIVALPAVRRVSECEMGG